MTLNPSAIIRRCSIILAWLSAIAVGFAVLQNYKSTPGLRESVPLQPPTNVAFAGSQHGLSLILFAHPKCPCTRASLRELSTIATQCPELTYVIVAFTCPDDADSRWLNSDIVQQAQSIPRISVIHDINGKQAASCGVRKSGHVLLYDSRGQLMFSGGITALRGHEGPNDGRDLIVAACKPSLRVLVVDDNVDAAQTLEMLLKASGHDVRMAFDGLTALEAALDYRPNVVLLDIGLPRMDGNEVAQKMRLHPVLQNVMLVGLTGYGQEADRQRSLEAGFDHHLVKPTDFGKLQQILATVSRHLPDGLSLEPIQARNGRHFINAPPPSRLSRNGFSSFSPP